MNPLKYLHEVARAAGISPLTLIRVFEEKSQKWWSYGYASAEDIKDMAQTVKGWVSGRWDLKTVDRERVPHREDPKMNLMRDAVRKWLNKGYIGGNSTRWDSAKRAFPRDYRGVGEELIELLLKFGYLIEGKTGGHRSVSVNPEKVEELKALVEREVLSDGLKEVLSQWEV